MSLFNTLVLKRLHDYMLLNLHCESIVHFAFKRANV